MTEVCKYMDEGGCCENVEKQAVLVDKDGIRYAYKVPTGVDVYVLVCSHSENPKFECKASGPGSCGDFESQK